MNDFIKQSLNDIHKYTETCDYTEKLMQKKLFVKINL